MEQELKDMSSKFALLADKIEKDVATKTELREHAELFKALNARIDRQNLENEKSPTIFGTKAAAIDFIGALQGAMSKSNYPLTERAVDGSLSMINKTALDSTTTGAG